LPFWASINLEKNMAHESLNAWDQWRSKRLRDLSESLFTEVQQATLRGSRDGGRRHAWGYWLAMVLAGVIHLVGVLIAVAGIYAIFGVGGARGIVIGSILVLIAVLTRPRFVPPPEHLLSEAEFPHLYRLVRAIELQLGITEPAVLGVSAEINANYRRAGFAGKPYVELGGPLMAALDHDERVALISHELAHGANGDPLRAHWFVGALRMIVSWSLSIRPKGIGRLGDGMPMGGIISIVGIPLEIAAHAVSQLLWWIARGIFSLVMRESQRAEYLADRLGADVSGDAAARASLAKIYLSDVVDMAIQRHALTSPDHALHVSIQQSIRDVSPENWLQIRERLDAEQWQADASHPPTALRIRALTGDASLADALASDDLRAGVEAETQRLVAMMARYAIDEKLEAIH
jgi:Zn-dependent protease with chaperone function